jgi:uncharacterized protein YceK
MAFRAICVAMALSSLPIAGCGTVANLANPRTEEGGRSPFGGVRQDLEHVRTSPTADSQHCRQMGLMLLGTADLPFSFVGDVVTWPYTAAYTCINEPIPAPPVAQATGESRPQAPPIELPEPRKLP